MFGFPSYYDAPRRAAYQDPFGGYGGYGARPTHRPQPHTGYRNPYGYQYDPRYYQQEDSDEEEEYTRPQRVAPQQQVRLDHLTPQQKLYLQQQQQKQQQQRLRQEQLQKLKEQQLREQQLRDQHMRDQDEEEEEEEEEAPHHQQHKRPTRAHHKQQHKAQPPQPQPKKLVEIDQNKEALKIQRQWRGWQVRRYNLIAKLRALAKIEAEVDAVVATPTSQAILGLDPSGPLPPTLDNYYVGNIPRNVLMLEHELTAKLIALDEISGKSDIIRPRRKALVTKIEGILSKVDAIKKVYSTMTPPPNPTPVISTPEDTHSATPASTDATTTTTSTQNKKKESEDNEEGLTASMDSMDIQDVSEPTPTIPPPSITPTTSSTPSTSSAPSSSSIPSQSSSSTTPASPSLNRVMPLKQMCFNLCDSLIKRGLVH